MSNTKKTTTTEKITKKPCENKLSEKNNDISVDKIPAKRKYTKKATCEQTEDIAKKSTIEDKTKATSKQVVNLEKQVKNIKKVQTLPFIKEENIQIPEIKVVKKKKILFVASECAPFIATGGLADVIGSLPNAIAKKENFDVSVMIPFYPNISEEIKNEFKFLMNFNVNLSWRNQYCGILFYERDGVKYYFVDNQYYFNRGGNIYGFYDDGERFAFFSKAVLDAVKHLDLAPDIIHCNDWQTASTVIYLKSLYYADEYYRNIKTIFTIHNIEYQGIYGKECYYDLFGFPENISTLVDFEGNINLMKGAIEMSDIVSTVSPTYAEEIKNSYFAHGLDGIILRNSQKLYGILNGIDIACYNPERDRFLFKNYSKENLSGKKVCKAELQKMLGLPIREDVPVISIISRLVSHKGLDLVKGIIESLLSEDVQVIILGKGDSSYENYFSNIANNYQGKCSAIIAYNQDLSRKIYSGSDMFLMPSKMEPCGLSQMIASRYGTVPIVRETGGLNDSIKPYYEGKGNGFTFKDYNAHDMLYVINEAIHAFYDKGLWKDIINKVMAVDFSWNNQAEKYAELYNKIN